jgi:hypothetical protein
MSAQFSNARIYNKCIVHVLTHLTKALFSFIFFLFRWLFVKFYIHATFLKDTYEHLEDLKLHIIFQATFLAVSSVEGHSH